MDDEMSPYASAGAGEKLRKRTSRPEVYENVSQEAGQYGKSELEQMTFTRSEAQHLISLMHSRTMEEEESITSGSIKRQKHGDKRDNFHAYVVGSSVLEEEIANSYTTMENLPDEVLSNILIRLLAKQLAQLRSVSKSWNALLSHSSFVKSHLHHSIHNNDQILLLFHKDQVTKLLTAKLSLDLTNFIKLPVNPQPQPECINTIIIIGSVNGLICSRYGDSIIHIWNPSLSAILTLPPYSTPSRADNNSITTYFRFGYDPKTDDYKVVKLTGLHRPDIEDVIEWWLQVEIYSMRKGSWELITARFPSHIAQLWEAINIWVHSHDGHLHWLGCNYINDDIDSQSERILSFDLGSNTFHEIPLPASTLDPDRINQVGLLAEKLYVLSYIEANDVFEVWVMEDYGVTESWVKRHVFSQFTGDSYTFGFTSDNVFILGHNDYLVLYDPFANKEKIFHDYCPEDQCIEMIVEYVDTLVWVALAKHKMVDHGGQIQHGEM